MTNLSKNYVTVRQAAQLVGVSRQRIHVIIKTYNVQSERVDGGPLMIPRPELKKIPKKRPTGKKLAAKK